MLLVFFQKRKRTQSMRSRWKWRWIFFFFFEISLYRLLLTIYGSFHGHFLRQFHAERDIRERNRNEEICRTWSWQSFMKSEKSLKNNSGGPGKKKRLISCKLKILFWGACFWINLTRFRAFLSVVFSVGIFANQLFKQLNLFETTQKYHKMNRIHSTTAWCVIKYFAVSCLCIC